MKKRRSSRRQNSKPDDISPSQSPLAGFSEWRGRAPDHPTDIDLQELKQWFLERGLKQQQNTRKNFPQPATHQEAPPNLKDWVTSLALSAFFHLLILIGLIVTFVKPTLTSEDPQLVIRWVPSENQQADDANSEQPVDDPEIIDEITDDLPEPVLEESLPEDLSEEKALEETLEEIKDDQQSQPTPEDHSQDLEPDTTFSQDLPPSPDQALTSSEQESLPLIGGTAMSAKEQAAFNALTQNTHMAARWHRKSRHQAIRRYGGTVESENAVLSALAWLAKQQKQTGAFNLSAFRPHMKAYNTASTALCLLPFLGHGETTRRGQYQNTVRKTAEYLLRQQSNSGFFNPKQGNYMYTQAIATLALIELNALDPSPVFKAAAQAGIEYLEKAQESSGGWGYHRQQRPERGDLSVAGWAIMALIEAKETGLRVSGKSWQLARQFITQHTNHAPVSMAYILSRRGVNGGHAMNAIGMLMHQYLKSDDHRFDDLVAQSLSYLPPRWSSSELRNNTYTWYYTMLAAFHLGGDAWQKSNAPIRDLLVTQQVKQGPDAGSWDPEAGSTGTTQGRLITTALACLTLEVYYRFLPLYQKDKVIVLNQAERALAIKGLLAGEGRPSARRKIFERLSREGFDPSDQAFLSALLEQEKNEQGFKDERLALNILENLLPDHPELVQNTLINLLNSRNSFIAIQSARLGAKHFCHDPLFAVGLNQAFEAHTSSNLRLNLTEIMKQCGSPSNAQTLLTYSQQESSPRIKEAMLSARDDILARLQEGR